MIHKDDISIELELERSLPKRDANNKTRMLLETLNEQSRTIHEEQIESTQQELAPKSSAGKKMQPTRNNNSYFSLDDLKKISKLSKVNILLLLICFIEFLLQISFFYYYYFFIFLFLGSVQ